MEAGTLPPSLARPQGLRGPRLPSHGAGPMAGHGLVLFLPTAAVLPRALNDQAPPQAPRMAITISATISSTIAISSSSARRLDASSYSAV